MKTTSLLSSTFTFTTLTLSFFLLLQNVNGVDPLFTDCFVTEKFGANSRYRANLNKLLGDLSLKTPQTGFGTGSVGQYKDRTFGLTLCRGDASPSDCKACVANATVDIRKKCPGNKGAIIWYDNCMLKYSNTGFFGRIDGQNIIYGLNLQVPKNPKQFNRIVKGFLTSLSEKASANPKKFATDSVYSDSQKVYGLVQCTRDLSSVDCRTCLGNVIDALTNISEGSDGGRYLIGSCNIRYEIYPFFTGA